MNQNIKIPLVISLLGIALLFFISDKISSPIILEIEKINSSFINETIQTHGFVLNEKHNEKTTTYTLINQNNSIEIFCFCKKSFINKTIEVIGVLESYNKKLQIRADKIEII